MTPPETPEEARLTILEMVHLLAPEFSQPYQWDVGVVHIAAGDKAYQRGVGRCQCRRISDLYGVGTEVGTRAGQGRGTEGATPKQASNGMVMLLLWPICSVG